MPRFLIILVIALLGASGGNAAKKKQRTIRSAQTEQQATQKKIKETTKKLNDNSAQTEKELNKLNLLRGEITQKERQILETRSQIDTLSNSITKAQDQLDDLNNRLEQLKNAYKTALRRLQGTQYATNELAYIFGSESFTKAYSRIRYTQEFANWRRRKSKEIKETLAKIEQKKAQLATLHSERATSLSALSSDQAILKAKQTDKTVAKLQRDGVNLQRALDKEKKRLKSIDNEISKMIEVERREREQQKKKQQDQKKGGTTKQKDSKTTPAKSKGGTTATKPKTKIDNSDPDAAMTSKFAAGKGSMLFPVASPYRIVAKYGSSNGQPYNTGIEIVLDGSANVRSIFEGTVSRIFQNHDGNYSIMVRHGAYITVYYNIGSLSVKAKEKVTAGQTLGRAATDARYGKPMLHFEVRKGSETLNPLSWVR